MKIFIAGATGVLGRRLVQQFASRRDDVIGLVRDDAGSRVVAALGGRPVRADLFDTRSLVRAAGGAEVVIHAATAIPTGGRAIGAWALNDRIRREGTQALTRAAVIIGARRYLQQSVVWVTRGTRKSPATESTRPSPSAVVASAAAGEEIALTAGNRHGLSVGVLRAGGFYAPDATHTRLLADLLKARRLPIIGAGENTFAPIHADDVASAFVAAARAEIPGIWHVVDDKPLPFAAFLRRFARLLDAPEPRSVPVWLARLAAGRIAVDKAGARAHTDHRIARREPANPSCRFYGLELANTRAAQLGI